MGLGDAMIGLGIGLQGQAKLDMNAPMQLLQKRMAAKRAEDKYLQDIMDDTGKELRKLGDAGYHSKYIPVVKEKIAAGLNEMYKVIEGSDSRTARNQVEQIFNNVSSSLKYDKNSSDFLFAYEKDRGNLLVPQEMDEALRNIGDFSDFEKLAPKLAQYGISYDPTTRSIGGPLDKPVDMVKTMKGFLDPSTATEFENPTVLKTPDGQDVYRYSLKIPKSAISGQFDGLLASSPIFEKTFKYNYGLENMDPADPNFIKAKDDFVTKVRESMSETVNTYEKPKTSFTYYGGAGPTTGEQVFDQTQSVTMPSTGTINLFGNEESTGDLVTDTKSFRPMTIGRKGDPTMGSFSIPASSIVKLDSPYSLTATGIDTKVRNNKVKGVSGSIEFKEPTAYVGYVTNKQIKVEIPGKLGQKKSVTLEPGTIVTSYFEKYINPKDKSKKLIVTGMSATDPKVDPNRAYSSAFVMTADLLSTVLSTIAPGSGVDANGRPVIQGNPKSPEYQQAVRLAEMYSNAAKFESGGMMGGLLLDDYLSLPAKERLNYIRTSEGTYKKK